jgi:hypothetical protein
VLAAIALIAACESESVSSGKGGDGSSGEGGSPDTGGSSGVGGSGGTAGDDAGAGGDAGAGTDGGAGGTSAGGTSAGGTSAGGTSAGGAGDGGAGDGGAGDGGAGGVMPACDLEAPFGTPVPLNDVNTTGWEARGSLTDDLLSIYFERDNVIHRATRSNPSDPFEMATPLPADIRSGYNPSLSPDALRLFFTRSGDIWVATRTSVLLEFSDPGPVGGVNPDPNVFMSSVSGDGTLYVHSDMDGNYDIYSAELLSSGSYGTLLPVDSINSPQGEGEAIVSADGLTIYLSSSRPPTPGIHRASRDTTSDDFGTPEPVTDIDPAFWPTWLSADGCMILLGRTDHPAGRGGPDLFVATKPR